MVSSEAQAMLIDLGKRVRTLRLARNERQKDFAARMGVSIPTLRKVEHGDPGVAVGIWLDTFWLLDRLGDLSQALSAEKSLFEQWEREHRPARKRVSRI